MGKDELFKLVYDALIDLSKLYTDYVITALTIIVIAIGWVLTSEKCRDFLSRNRSGYLTSLTAISVIATIYSIVSIGFYSMSQRKFRLLEGLKYVDYKYYQDSVISLHLILLNLLLNLTMFALLFIVIYNLPKQVKNE